MSFKSIGIVIVSLLLIADLATAQYVINSGSVPPPSGSEPWRGILDYTRAVDWRSAGVKINGVLGIPTYTYVCANIAPSGQRNWLPNHVYAPGAAIADSRGNVETTNAGGTSGPTEPLNGNPTVPVSWPIAPNTTTTESTGLVWNMTTGDQPPMTDTAKITNAIINCGASVAANPPPGVGGIVQLSAGDYYLTAGIIFNGGYHYPLPALPAMTAPVSNVLLRGQGPMQTTLHFTDEGPCIADVCVQGSSASQIGYNAGGGYTKATNPGSSAVWMGSGQFQGVYAKGDTQLISGPWSPAETEPQAGNVIFLDQNNDAVSICPATPPTAPPGQPPGDCQLAGIPGATASSPSLGGTATIVTSVPHGFSVGQCVGIGDVGGHTASADTGIGFNTGANTDKTTICGSQNGGPANGQPPHLPSWWLITGIGCIQSTQYTDVSNCGQSDINAFQYTVPACAANNLSCLSPNGGGQATVDTLGAWLTSVGGATMVVGSNPAQSARLCPPTPTTLNDACLPGEISIRAQLEIKQITAVTPAGTGTCPPPPVYKCYTIDPPLYMNNWRASQRPGIWWTGPKDVGDGLEAFTYRAEHDYGDGHIGGIHFMNAYNGWVRNVRALEINRNFVYNTNSARITAVDNYIGGTRGGASTAYVFEDNAAADTLIMNNICEHTVSCLMTSTVMGRVAAFNYMLDGGYSETVGNLMPLMTMNHLAAFMNLFEGNDSAGIQTDNFHGTGGLATGFRSRSRGQDRPTKFLNRNGLSSESFNRGLNFVGMLMGTPNVQINYTDNTPSHASGGLDQIVFQFGRWKESIGAFGWDSLAWATSLRWGNYDTVTGTVRWCGTGSEGPGVCSCGNAQVTPYNCRLEAEIPTQGATFLSPNAIPASHTLPNSFFLSAQPYFWVTNWGTPNWPAMGPDVNANGSPLDTSCQVTANVGRGPGTFAACDGEGQHHAYQIPAQICFNNLPADTTWTDAFFPDPTTGLSGPGQKVYAITAANYTTNGQNSGGHTEVTLTANNNLNNNVAFTYTIEVTGVTPPDYNGTWQVNMGRSGGGTGITSTTISYFIPTTPSGPGTGGQATTPNYRQYDAHMCYPNLPY